MFQNLRVSAALAVLALLVAPSRTSADVHPIEPSQPVVGEPATDYAREGVDSKDRFPKLSEKSSMGTEVGESVDCFYDYNRNSPDCGGGKRN